MRPFLIVMPLIVLGCKTEEPPPGGCGGYFSPGANIYVRNFVDGQIITNAQVEVNSIGESDSANFQALYIDGDDRLSNSETYAYYTTIEINEINWLVNFSVEAPGYSSFQSDDYEFILNTACGAENNFVQEVYLCPASTSCE
jgi:hypothetical protein